MGLTDSGILQSQTAEPQGTYAKPYRLFIEGNLQEAEGLFRNLLDLDHEPVLQDYTLYFLGAIASSQGAHDIAKDYFARLKKEFPRSVWLNDANLHLAKAALNENDVEQAIELLEALASGGGKEGVLSEALYLLGKSYGSKGDFKQAHSRFQTLRDKFPFSSWAVKAKADVTRIRNRYAEPLGLNRPQALLQEGRILLKEGDSRKAERIFRRLTNTRKGKSLHLTSLQGLARVYRRTRERNKEIKTLRDLIAEFPDRPEAGVAAYRIAALYWNQRDNTRALEQFKRFEKQHPRSRLRDKARIAIGRIYESLGKPEQAMRVFADFPERFPKSELRWEATWRLAWMHYLRSDFRRAFSTFGRVAVNQAPAHHRAGSWYWQARSAERLGQPDDAKRLYRRVLDATAESYYKGPATDALKRLGERLAQRKPGADRGLPEPVAPPDPDLTFHLSRAARLADLSLHRLALVELDEARKQVGRDHTWRVKLMRDYVANGGFDRGIRLALQLGRSGEFSSFRYPLAYWETIQREATKHDLDPFLILALIRQESLFNPDAVSPAFALGLMQLLHSTARKEADKLELSEIEPDNLFDPDLNLTLGIQHLKRLFHAYPRSIPKVLAAYNAGRGPVDGWEKRFGYLDEQEFIERIPYRETRFYVKQVLRNYRIYKEIYGGR